MSSVFVFHLMLLLASTLAPSKCDEPRDFYTFEVDDIEGNPVSLEKYRGKVHLVFYYLLFENEA